MHSPSIIIAIIIIRSGYDRHSITYSEKSWINRKKWQETADTDQYTCQHVNKATASAMHSGMCISDRSTLTGPQCLALCWQTQEGFSSPPLWGYVSAGTEKQRKQMKKVTRRVEQKVNSWSFVWKPNPWTQKNISCFVWYSILENSMKI